MLKMFGFAFCFIFCAYLISGCALGSASAAYALNARSAETLTAEAEDRLVNRIKREVVAEIQSNELKEAAHRNRVEETGLFNN